MSVFSPPTPAPHLIHSGVPPLKARVQVAGNLRRPVVTSQAGPSVSSVSASDRFCLLLPGPRCPCSSFLLLLGCVGGAGRRTGRCRRRRAWRLQAAGRSSSLSEGGVSFVCRRWLCKPGRNASVRTVPLGLLIFLTQLGSYEDHRVTVGRWTWHWVNYALLYASNKYEVT